MLRQKLSADPRHELEQRVKTTHDVKLYRRAKVILYQDAGDSAKEIRVHTEYSERAQGGWLARDCQEGVDGLRDRLRSGRPRQERAAPVAPSEPVQRASLEEWARITLEQMQAHHPKPYLRARAQRVLLRAKGGSHALIAHLLGVQVKTVRRVLAHYDPQGLRG